MAISVAQISDQLTKLPKLKISLSSTPLQVENSQYHQELERRKEA